MVGEGIRIVWIGLQMGAYVCNRCDGNCNGNKSVVLGFRFHVSGCPKAWNRKLSLKH